jgi:glycosyltransferase involved in cell wall biosynthesis
VRPCRICIVAPSLDIVGGQAVVAQRLMQYLGEDEDLVLSFVPHNPRLPGMLRTLQRVRYVRTVTTSVAYLVSLLRELPRHDVIHIFSASYWSFLLAPAPAVLLGRLFGKRVILNYRSGEADDHLKRWRWLTSTVMDRATLIVVPSNYLVDVFARHGLAARPIFNFVDLAAIPYRERSTLRPLLLSNRNFAPHYNVACILRAFRRIQDVRSDAQLVVAGDGEERDKLHLLARRLGLRHVDFVGQVTPAAMSALYDAADVYLNAPNVDNMPNSVIEAFAAGLPVATTDAGGIPYIVTHGETGLLSTPNDDEALARHVVRLLEEPALGRRLARNARREVIDKFSWPAVHGMWRSAYGVPARERATHP